MDSRDQRLKARARYTSGEILMKERAKEIAVEGREIHEDKHEERGKGEIAIER